MPNMPFGINYPYPNNNNNGDKHFLNAESYPFPKSENYYQPVNQPKEGGSEGMKQEENNREGWKKWADECNKHWREWMSATMVLKKREEEERKGMRVDTNRL